MGEDVLNLLTGQGDLLESGPDHALKSLCHASQERWKANSNAYSEDISGILIHWVGTGLTPTAPTGTAPGAGVAFRAHPNAFQNQPRVVPMSEVTRVPGSPSSQQ